MSGRMMSEKEAAEAAEYTQTQVEAATRAAQEASEAFVEVERQRAEKLAESQARLDAEREARAQIAAAEQVRKQQEAAAAKEKRAAERHQALSQKRQAGKKKQGLPLVTPPASDAEGDAQEAGDAEPDGAADDVGGAADDAFAPSNDDHPLPPLTPSPPAVVHPQTAELEPVANCGGVSEVATRKRLPASRPEDELAAFVQACERGGDLNRTLVLDGLLSHVPVLPEFGSPMMWPRLFELLEVPSFEYLLKVLQCREPRKKTPRSYALVIIDALRQHHYNEYQPLEHPTDVCGACKRPMPWRPPNQPHAHNCDKCGKPLHGAGVPDCSRIIVEERNFYCDAGCQGLPSAPVRKRTRKVGVHSFDDCPSPTLSSAYDAVLCA